MGHKIPGGVKEIKQMFTERGGGVSCDFQGLHGVGGRWEPKEVRQRGTEARLRRGSGAAVIRAVL